MKTRNEIIFAQTSRILLAALLPQDLASECRVGNVRDQILTVHINNAAWATRFRFLVPALLPELRRLGDFSDITEMRLKVVAATDPLPRAAERTRA